MTNTLDNPHPVDDFEIGNIDSFKGSLLGNCHMFDAGLSVEDWEIFLFHSGVCINNKISCEK